jgi:hypothetical protein
MCVLEMPRLLRLPLQWMPATGAAAALFTLRPWLAEGRWGCPGCSRCH